MCNNKSLFVSVASRVLPDVYIYGEHYFTLNSHGSQGNFLRLTDNWLFIINNISTAF
ncbi:hypothetical protein JOE11_000524 [Robbsia andropogonis]